MTYNKLLTKIKDYFISDVIINQVTRGFLDDVDLSRESIFPMLHIMVNTATPLNTTVRFNVSLIAMDIVDISKEESTDSFRGNDNEIDVLNSMLEVLLRFDGMMKRGELLDDRYELVGTPELEPFVERFENNQAGWTMTFDIDLPNTTTVC